MARKLTLKQKMEIAKSWGMKVNEVDWNFVGKIKKRKPRK